MGVTIELGEWWPLAIPLLVLVTVFVSFAQCAVAELVVRFAAALYARDPSLRAAKTDEWVQVLRDMKPRERPMHAGSFLWLGARHVPTTLSDMWIDVWMVRWWFAAGYVEAFDEVLVELCGRRLPITARMRLRAAMCFSPRGARATSSARRMFDKYHLPHVLRLRAAEVERDGE